MKESWRAGSKKKGIGGFEAVMLWLRYQNYGDQGALALLLQYNKEDVVNLKTLRERLSTFNPFDRSEYGYKKFQS